MKKIFYIGISLFALHSFAQETLSKDALLYSIDNTTGTARYRALSGAFGALGGDLSAINQNPAGSAFLNNNFLSITASNYNTKNASNYFGTQTSDNNSSLDLNQLGGALVFNANEKSDWKKIVVAINYENSSNFDANTYIAGTNPNNSIDRYFLNQAQGITLNNLQLMSGETVSSLYQYLGENVGFGAQQAFLGYQAYLLEPNDDTNPNNVDYYSNVPLGGNYYQQNYVSSEGYNGKLAFNFASSYKDKLFLGFNLNAHFTDYVKVSTLREDNTNPLYTTGYTAKAIRFNNELYTYGTGFSFNLGGIYKVDENFRLGASYESPTWYRLNDELTQSLTVVTTDGTSTFTENVNPNVLNLYPEYRIQSPSKITGSLAYIFQNKGLISADISSKNYSNAKFKPTADSFFQSLNTDISNSFTNALEYRIGGEYKIDKFSLRAGYRFEESPYKNKNLMGDLTGYSGGIGYNFGISRLDLTYAYDQREFAQELISSGMTDMANIKRTNNNIVLTYSVNF